MMNLLISLWMHATTRWRKQFPTWVLAACVTGISPVILSAVCVFASSGAVWAQNKGDDVLLEMQSSFKKGDSHKLNQQLKHLRSLNKAHPLEPWAAYWELRSRLDGVSAEEVQQFLKRYANTYLEDRLRADWLQLLGKRSQWGDFEAVYSAYRMRDDKELQCYALAADVVRTGRDASQDVGRIWLSQKDRDDGCMRLVEALIEVQKMPAAVVSRKARQVMEAGQARWAQQIQAMVAKNSSEELVLDLLKTAGKDHDKAATQLQSKSKQLKAEQSNWVWGFVGRQAALKRDDDALAYFSQISNLEHVSDDHLAWWVRAALRATAQDAKVWLTVIKAIEGMSEAQKNEPVWVYWLAKAYAARGAQDATARGKSIALWESIAFDKTAVKGFYEQLAQEELGRPLGIPSATALGGSVLTPEEKLAAKNNPGLQRALYAIALGLRAEGVREWNYHTNLHQAGGMNERELWAAADLACAAQVWDRCINTSERTKSADWVAWSQRYPTPLKELVLPRSKEIGLPPAFVYGLVRQESRFIFDVRSHVGASGLMQLMPATAKWTAKKIGIDGFTKDMVNDPQINVRLGTGYLQMLLDEFDGVWPLAIAAYNAGPGRSRAWRQGSDLEAAMWIENIPFNETRDYVKKVLANAVVYEMLLERKSASLLGKMPRIGPRSGVPRKENSDLP